MKRTIIHRILFQVHLWAGLTLGIYALLIGITGSVLVFRDEIVHRISPEPSVAAQQPNVSYARMAEQIAARMPEWNVWAIEAPRANGAAWSSYLLPKGGGPGKSVFVDAEGRLLGERRLEGTWLEFCERFHSNLLIRNGGRWYNGVAGLALAALSLTGLYLWWPARGQWSSAFRIVRTSNWKGVLYDLHRVLGAVTLAFTLMFCITGAYFTWPTVYRKLIAAILPTNPVSPAAKVAPGTKANSLDSLLATAQSVVRDGVLLRVLNPTATRQPVRVVFRHGAVEQSYRTSEVALDPITGRVLEVNAYEDRRVGDHLAGFLAPLHTGHFAGLGTKLVWAAAGLMLPLLFISGVVMWCNRVVGPRWLKGRTLRASVAQP